MRNFLNKINPFSKTKAEYSSTNTNSIRTFFSGGTSVTSSNAQNIADVFSCVNIKATSLSIMPLKTYIRTGKGKEDYYSSKLYEILRYEPNPNLTAPLYMKMISQDLDLRGNHYSQIVRNGLGEVTALYPLVSDKMEVSLSTTNKKIYKYDNKIIQSNIILHIFDIPDTQGLKGISRIEYLKEYLQFEKNANSFGNAIFKNSASPSGAFEMDGELGDEAYNRLKDDLKEKYSGLKNTGTPLLLEGGLTFKPLSIKNSDAEWLASRKLNREQISAGFGVPASMINDSANIAYGNLEQQYLAFYSGTLYGLAYGIELKMRQSLLKQSEKKYIVLKFKFNAKLRADIAAKAAYYQTRFNIGSITPNEIRAYEDENRISDGDETYAQLNLATLKTLNKQDKNQGANTNG